MSSISGYRTAVARRRQRSCTPRIDAATVTLRWRGPVATFGIAVALLCLPSTSLAAGAAGDSPQRHRSSAELLSVGAGYGHDARSQPVRDLQSRLRTLGYDPGPIDGVFGPLTEAAVESFQRAQRLATDGVVGPRTGAALRRGGPREHAGLHPVRELQRDLRAVGYEPGPIDGVYGPLTEAAVERFQTAQGLAVDGVAGRQTAARLEARRVALESAKPAVGTQRADRASDPASTDRARDARARHVPPEPSPLGEPSTFADSSSPLLRPVYLALVAALALVLLLTGVRAARRRARTPAPAATRRIDTRWNLGLACAVLLGGLVVGAAGGALFATRASPDNRAEATARSLLNVSADPVRPAASRSERTRRDGVARARVTSARRAASTTTASHARVTSARRAAPTASAGHARVTSAQRAAPAASAGHARPTRPTPAATPGDEPVVGAVTAASPRAAEQPPRRAGERVPLVGEVARAPSYGGPWLKGEAATAASPDARVATRPR